MYSYFKIEMKLKFDFTVDGICPLTVATKHVLSPCGQTSNICFLKLRKFVNNCREKRVEIYRYVPFAFIYQLTDTTK